MGGITRVGNLARTRTNNRFLLGDSYDWGQDSKWIRAEANDDGVTYTGKVQAGTLLGIHTASGKYLPCGVATVPTGAASATQTVTDASVFRVGDNVDVYEDDNSTLISGDLEILSISGNVLTLDASVTTVNDSVIRRDDGTENPVGICRDDVSTQKTWDDQGEPVHADAACYVMYKAIVDWRYVKGANAITLAALGANAEVQILVRNAS